MERTCDFCGADPGEGSFCQHCGAKLTVEEPPSNSTTPTNAASDATPAPAPPAATPPRIPVPQAPAKRSGFLRGCLIVGVIGLVVLVVGGFFVWRFINEEVLPEIEATTDAFNTFSDVPPGPCYDIDVEDSLLAGWTEVSCSGPHQIEVTFAARFEEGAFPGDEYLTQRAEDTCREAFEVYVGIPPEASVYGVDWLLPTEETWAEGARQGICLVVAEDGSDLAGTVKESES